MRLRMFLAREGDALLLSHGVPTSNGARWTHVMIDGGRDNTYQAHVRPHLPTLETSPGETAPTIDLVVLSHICGDHVEGLRRYAEDLVEWAVRAHLDEQAATDAELAANLAQFAIDPQGPGWPPRPQEFWHNGFREQAGDNVGEIRDVLSALAASIAAPAGEPVTAAERLDARFLALEAGERDAHHLSRRFGSGELNVPRNTPVQGKLMRVEQATRRIPVGSIAMTVLGPSAEELEALRSKWKGWLGTAKGISGIAEVEERADRIHRALEVGDLDAASTALATPRLSAESAADLRARICTQPLGAAATLGTGETSENNLSSLMLLAEVGDGPSKRRMVLTGDGHHLRIIAGLRAAGVLDPGDHSAARVDVLKLPHHGSEHNADERFFRRVIADHYVVCSDGSHGNPDLRILDALLDSRLDPDEDVHALHDDWDKPFELWFNTHPSKVNAGTVKRTYIEGVFTHVTNRCAGSNRVTVHWNSDAYLDLELAPPPAPPTLWISEVMPNPQGGGAAPEWVKVANSGAEDIDASDLRLQDRQGGSHTLAGTIPGNGDRTFMLPVGGPIRLANSGDDIILLRGNEEVHRVSWTSSQAGVAIQGTPPGG